MSTVAPRPTYSSRLTYTDQRGLALYVADKYAAILIGSVLEVGCGEAPLRKLVHQPFRYVGVDSAADADERVDVEREPLPFAERRFDTVVCTVLGRFGEPARVLEELCRVARGRVIAAAPAGMREIVGRAGRGFAVEQVDEAGGTAWWVLKREGGGGK